jgi:hypothetical protein
MNTWKNIPGKIWISILSLDPFLKRRARKTAEPLDQSEAHLFLSMNRYDLAHAITVAARLRDDPLLYQAALLHDSGKLHSDFGLFTRWLFTVLEILAPKSLQQMIDRVEATVIGDRPIEKARSIRGAWRRGLYMQAHHGEIAAELLWGLGSDDELIRLVAGHQADPVSPRARRLRDVDDRF